jgi:2-dehydro-3-deoxygluconokinase
MQGIKTDFIARGGNRLGLNFYENGVSMRPSKVIYDRANSAFAEADINDFDFEKNFDDADWFHISGITPALSDKTAALTQKAMETAKSKGVMISCDLNYRRKLWSPEKARSCMTKLMEYVDVCIGNEEDAEITLGFKPRGTDVFKGEFDLDGYKDIFMQMKEKFGFKYIGTTLRESHSASDNGWSVLCFDGKQFCHSPKYEIHLLDRGGGGASFAAGFIYGIINDMPLEKTTAFAAATSALKQTIMGDFNLASLEDVLSLCEGNSSGRVQR